MELIQEKILDFIQVSFMIVGHTKFEVDRVFSSTSKAYNQSDVFNTEELASVMSQADNLDATIDDGSLVYPWREAVDRKYTKLSGIRSLHDFLVVRHPESGKAVMTVRNFSYGGPAQSASIKVKDGIPFDEHVVPSQNYIQLNMIRTLSSTKLDHLTQMYQKFIQPEKHPSFITQCISHCFELVIQL